MTAPTPGQAEDWGVYVNEPGILATGIGAVRWNEFMVAVRAQGTAARLSCLSSVISGSEWHLMCRTKTAAADARETLIEQGIHKNHVKVARLAACQAKAAQRQRRHDEWLEFQRAGLAETEASRG